MTGRCGDLWIVRHGETAWSVSEQHTGRSDIPLTDEGRRSAVELGRRLEGRRFALVLTSPPGSGGKGGPRGSRGGKSYRMELIRRGIVG